jgi:hypothetical protein
MSSSPGHDPRSVFRWRRWVVFIATVALLVATAVLSDPSSATASGQSGPSTSDASPVNLATPVDMADGMAHQSAIVRSGDARIEVLSPTLLRLEYSPSGTFENKPTVNALNRRMPVPPYTVHIAGGWFTLRTSRATLRYKVGSGPFTATNTSLRFADGRAMTTVHPTWDWECPFDQVCQAAAAVLSGKAAIGYSLTGYDTSTTGFVSDLDHPGDSATWDVLGAPSGPARLSLRYSNTVDPIVASGPKTLALVINGHQVSTLVAAQTSDADPWSTLTTTASLVAGTNAVRVACVPGDSCNVELDSLSIGPADDPAPVTAPTDPLGGWMRGFDTASRTHRTGPAPRAPPGPPARSARAVAYRRTPGQGRLAAAGRHPERSMDQSGLGEPRPRPVTSRTATSSSTATTTRGHCARWPS